MTKNERIAALEREVADLKRQIQPIPAVSDRTDWPVWETRWTFTVPNPSKCLFDGLPDGVYGLVCPCPQHSVTC